jgi:hypothetical protein
LDRAERFALDVQYARTWSFALDLKILLRTALVVLTRRGVEISPDDSGRSMQSQPGLTVHSAEWALPNKD